MQTLRILLIVGFTIISAIAFSQENCSNGIDDDMDGLVDLNDIEDCACNNTENISSIIPNYSFEDMDCCPDNYSQLTCATNWIQASGATSDYYNTCNQFPPWVQSGAAHGNGVVGAIYRSDWQEHVGTCLLEPISADTDYLLQMSISSRIALTGAENTLGPIDVIIYGSPNCADLPFSGEICPIGLGSWEIIGSYTYDPSLDWSVIDITLHSPVDINAISIGPPCEFPDAYLNSNLFPYFVYDNLLLNTTESFDIAIKSKFYNADNDVWVQEGSYIDPVSGETKFVGEICPDEVEFSVTTEGSGNFQWYYNGTAIIGETDTILHLNDLEFEYGTYQFAVTDTAGFCNAISINPEIPELPDANFVVDVSGACVPVDINISDATSFPGNIDHWEWYVDGELVSQGLDNFSTSIIDAGLHNASLMVEAENFCIDSIYASVLTGEPPVINSTIETGCIGEATIFNGQATSSSGLEITDWYWDFGDGNLSELQTPTHIYNQSLPYTVVLTVIDDNKCTQSDTLIVTPMSGPNISFVTEDICIGDPAIFSNTTNLSLNNIQNWNWNFGDGEVSDLFEPEHLYTSDGSYDVTLTATNDNGCVSEYTSTQIAHNSELNVDFTFQNTCFNDLTRFSDVSISGSNSDISNWSWDFGDGNFAIGPSPTHVFAEAQTYEVTLTVSNSHNCSAELTKTVQIHPLPQINFESDIVCLGSPTKIVNYSTIESGSIDEWTWTFGDNDSAFVANPEHQYGEAGNFEINCTGISNAGCSASNTGTQIISKANSDFIYQFDPNCAPACGSFESQSSTNEGEIIDCLWTFSNGESASGKEIEFCFDNPSNFDILKLNAGLKIRDSYGCTDSIVLDSIIEIWPNPIADFESDKYESNILKPNFSFTNLSISHASSIWDFGDGNISDSENPSHSFEEPQTFPVQLTVFSDQGCQDNLTMNLYVKPVYNIYVPTAFTPSGDGINEVLKIVVNGDDIDEYLVQIYDRHGHIVYASSDVNEAWDGSYFNEKSYYVSDGIYSWNMTVQFANNTDVIQKNGSLTILR